MIKLRNVILKSEKRVDTNLDVEAGPRMMRALRELEEWSEAARRLVAIEVCLEKTSDWLAHSCD